MVPTQMKQKKKEKKNFDQDIFHNNAKVILIVRRRQGKPASLTARLAYKASFRLNKLPLSLLF